MPTIALGHPVVAHIVGGLPDDGHPAAPAPRVRPHPAAKHGHVGRTAVLGGVQPLAVQEARRLRRPGHRGRPPGSACGTGATRTGDRRRCRANAKSRGSGESGRSRALSMTLSMTGRSDTGPGSWPPHCPETDFAFALGEGVDDGHQVLDQLRLRHGDGWLTARSIRGYRQNARTGRTRTRQGRSLWATNRRPGSRSSIRSINERNTGRLKFRPPPISVGHSSTARPAPGQYVSIACCCDRRSSCCTRLDTRPWTTVRPDPETRSTPKYRSTSASVPWRWPAGVRRSGSLPLLLQDLTVFFLPGVAALVIVPTVRGGRRTRKRRRA